MSEKVNHHEADERYGVLSALNGYEYHTIQIYRGTKEGITTCRVISPDNEEVQIISADDFQKAVKMAQDWVNKENDTPGFRAATLHAASSDKLWMDKADEIDRKDAENATLRERVAALEDIRSDLIEAINGAIEELDGARLAFKAQDRMYRERLVEDEIARLRTVMENAQ